MMKKGIFTTNVLKIIACVSMLIDHIGAYLFPNILIMRVIGRIAFPIFAFFIAKGSIYTRNKGKRLLTILGLGLICEIVGSIFVSSSGNILLTFSLSISLIYIYLEIVKSFQNENQHFSNKLMWITCMVCGLLICYIINAIYPLDYGFMGILCPLIVSIFSLETYKISNDNLLKYRNYFNLLGLFLGLTLVILSSKFSIQFVCYLSLIFVGLYNNKRGKLNLKYLFYLFYPLHLVAIYIFSLI